MTMQQIEKLVTSGGLSFIDKSNQFRIENKNTGRHLEMSKTQWAMKDERDQKLTITTIINALV